MGYGQDEFLICFGDALFLLPKGFLADSYIVA
jgi:hypothetical protein